jgi:hypothetical protein
VTDKVAPDFNLVSLLKKEHVPDDEAGFKNEVATQPDKALHCDAHILALEDEDVLNNTLSGLESGSMLHLI